MIIRRKKVIIPIILAVVVLVGLLLFFTLRTDDWEPPTQSWGLAFDSIEEINQIREFLDNRDERGLLEFIEGTNNGENIVNSRRDVEYFLELFDDIFLPIDSNWVDFSYNYTFGDFIIVYREHYSAELSFIIRPEESFDEKIEANPNYTHTDITNEIAIFAEEFDDTSLRIGNGVQAFSFHRYGDEEGSIRETNEGFDVRVSLNVERYFVHARVSYAQSLEEAFKILANIEFGRGAW